MKPNLFGWALAVLLVVALATPAVAQSGFAWWKDEQVVKALGLAAEQSKRIDHIFQKHLIAARPIKEELDRHNLIKLKRLHLELQDLPNNVGNKVEFADVDQSASYHGFVAVVDEREIRQVNTCDKKNKSPCSQTSEQT